MKNTICTIVFMMLFFTASLLNMNNLSAVDGGLASLMITPAYADNSNSNDDHDHHHHEDNSNSNSAGAKVCSCGVNTSNVANDSNDNATGDDNVSNVSNVDDDGQDNITNEANVANDDNMEGDDNTAGNSQDNIDNASASAAACTCADGSTGFWSSKVDGPPIVPGASSVPKALREIHGQ